MVQSTDHFLILLTFNHLLPSFVLADLPPKPEEWAVPKSASNQRCPFGDGAVHRSFSYSYLLTFNHLLASFVLLPRLTSLLPRGQCGSPALPSRHSPPSSDTGRSQGSTPSPGEPILLPSRKNRRGLRPRPPIKLCQEAERSPCWSAFRLARAFPLGVRGPVDLRAFRRRASSSWGCQATTLEQTHQTTSLPGPGGGAGGQTKRSLKITSEILSQI